MYRFLEKLLKNNKAHKKYQPTGINYKRGTNQGRGENIEDKQEHKPATVCKLKTLLGKIQTVQRAANEFHRREAEDSKSFAPARMKPLINGESSQGFSQDSFAGRSRTSGASPSLKIPH